MANPALVVVEWNDAWVEGNEPVLLNEVGHAHKPHVIITIGWLLMDDETGISLANEHYKDDNTYRGRTFIPRGMVGKVTTYKLAQVKQKSPPKITLCGSESSQSVSD